MQLIRIIEVIIFNLGILDRAVLETNGSERIGSDSSGIQDAPRWISIQMTIEHGIAASGPSGVGNILQGIFYH